MYKLIDTMRCAALPNNLFFYPGQSECHWAEKPKGLHNMDLLVLSITSSQRISDLGKIVCQICLPSSNELVIISEAEHPLSFKNLSYTFWV